MNSAMDIVKDVSLDFKQKKAQLAAYAQDRLPYVPIGEKARAFMESGVIDDLGEGHAPCSPRYILPDYPVFMKNGSEFLNLQPPKDFYEATAALQILYGYVPSVTGFPVFLGKLDELLEPFADTVTEAEMRKLLRNFLIYVDRVFPDGFVHMDIGPADTQTGRMVLELERELKKVVPNLSLLVNRGTPQELLKLAAETALDTGKPYFANDEEIIRSLGERYGVASCYNSLKLGGGSYTLIRLNLKKAAGAAENVDDFVGRVLPEIIHAQCEVINARVKFLVEDVRFFENSFLAREGMLSISNFTAMAGVYGLYECVEKLTGGLKLGRDDGAFEAAKRITDAAAACVAAEKGEYCGGTGGKIGFHAQSLIQSDLDVTAGVRIKIGEEPSLYDQIRIEGRLQKPFNTGVSDIYLFDATAKQNVEGLLTIIKGAFKNGIKMFAVNSADSELVRITGYLVKKSDIEKYRNHEQIREDTVALGADSIKNHHTENRAVRKIV